MRMKNFIINDYLSFKITVVALFVALTSTNTVAGWREPPCIQVIDLGVPEYRDRKELLERSQVELGLFGFKQSNGYIRKVFEGTAADEAGLLADDKIREIREKDTGLVKTDRFQVGQVYVFDITRDSVALEIDVEYKSVDESVDPVPAIFSRLIEDEINSCPLEFEFAPTPLPQYSFWQEGLSELKESLFDSNGAFKCHDAHIELGYIKQFRHDGDTNTVFFIRGGWRVIFSMPHWGTMCFDTKSVSTLKKIEASFGKFHQQVLGDYISVHGRLEDP
jgi:hypothetical protein